MHRQPHAGHSVTRLTLFLVAAAVLVTAAVAAAPAVAAPTATELALEPQRPTVTWNATAVLNGVLQTDTAVPLPVDGQQVLVQYREPRSSLWITADTITNTPAEYGTGAYTYSWRIVQSYYWRMVFEGTADYAADTSQIVYVKVRPVLGKPACPASIKVRKRFTVSGSLKPQFDAGSRTVKVRAQRYSSGRWRTFGTYAATNADSGAASAYSARISISRTGKYRFYASSAGSSTFASARSAFSRSLRVK
jgi:hypothetical protein